MLYYAIPAVSLKCCLAILRSFHTLSFSVWVDHFYQGGWSWIWSILYTMSKLTAAAIASIYSFL